MSCQRHGLLLIGLAVLSGLVGSGLQAQSSPPPQTYSLTESPSQWGPSQVRMTRKVYRDGPKILIDQSYPPIKENPQGFHVRTLYDLQANKSYTLDLIETARPCGATTYSGDWGDPFAAVAQTRADLAQQHARAAGTETINGLAAKEYEMPNPQGAGTWRIWVEEKYGLTVKMEEVAAAEGSAYTYGAQAVQSLQAPSIAVDVARCLC